MRTKGTAKIFSWVLVTVLAGIPLVHSQTGAESSAPSQPSGSELLQFIVTRMEQAQLANKQHYRPYTVTREYKLFDDESKAQQGETPSSQVTANVDFVPPNHKSFQITKVEGSDRGKIVVKHVLENESEMSKRGVPLPITSEFYEFQMNGEETLDGRPCWVLQIKPHHDDKTTIRGTAWIDKETFLTHKVEGEMAKSPSWWVKKVQLTLRYSDAGGMWLPASSYAVADVRFFGRHVLTSEAVRYETAQDVARVTPEKSSRHRPPMVGTIYVSPYSRYAH